MPVATPDSYTFTPGTPLYAGLPMPTPGGLITTLSLVNTSGSTQAANFVSPMMGVPFKQGDMPSGEYPIFTLEDDTPCPATIWGVTSWPDGSMKFCGAMIRVPTTIAGSGTLTIEVKSGGTAPAASSRGTSDFTAADLKTELTGVTNLSGVWTASLNTAITDATDIVVIGDGPAGKVYRIGGGLKQSGSAHGQLHCWHYVAALQNSAGGLLGVRYLGRVAQPWGDVSSPTPTKRVATAVLKSGASTIRTLTGHDTTETVGSNIGIAHYTSFFTAGTDGKWDYVQGGGSASADCTVHVAHDKTYFIKTKLVPPYDTTLSPSANASADYYPYGRALMVRATGDTSERDELGVISSWSVRHLLRQTAADLKTVRVTGLVSGGFRVCARRSTTGQIVPVTETNAASSYTGLGTIQTTWRLRPGDTSTGFVTPATDASLWTGEFEPSHRPGAVYYPYLATGEPQYLDMLVEQAANFVANKPGGNTSLTSSNPVTTSTIRTNGNFGERDLIVGGTTYKGGAMLYHEGLMRITAWQFREYADVAAIYPDVCPSGTEFRKYMRDQIDASLAAMIDYHSRFGTDWANSGIHYFENRPESSNPWTSGYLSNAVCHASSILPSANLSAFRSYLGKFWENAATTGMDIACMFSYGGNIYDENAVRITNFSNFLPTISGALSFSTATNRATVAVSNGNNQSWSPTNGDVFAFAAIYGGNPFPAVSEYTRLYAVNCTGQTCQFSLTPGGSALTVPSNITVGSFAARIQNFAPDFTAEGFVGPAAYIANITGAIRHHAACGDSVSSAVTASSARLTTSGVTFGADPKNAMTTAYPS